MKEPFEYVVLILFSICIGLILGVLLERNHGVKNNELRDLKIERLELQAEYLEKRIEALEK